MKDFIGYGQIIEDSMRDAVRNILLKAETEGLQGEHHFVISFFTSNKDVKMAKILKEKFPLEMVIVIQHQFRDLKINEDNFEVSLSFNGVFEKLVVPFSAITSFSDPSMNFGVKFNFDIGVPSDDDDIELDMDDSDKSKDKKDVDLSQKIISLDDFRKNQD